MTDPPPPTASQNRFAASGSPSHRPAPTASRRRRWLRIGLPLLLFLLVSAYAMLPRWLPRDWLRERIAHDLTMLLDCPVRVGDLSLDWTDGVVLRDIVVADAATRGGRLLHIERVRCGLTPLRWAAGRGLDRLELLRPSVFVQINDDGRLNLAAIEPDRGNPATLRWLVRNAVVHVINVADPVTPAVSIGNLDLTLDAVTGKAKVELSEGRLVRDVTVATPQGVWSAAANLEFPSARVSTPVATKPADRPFHGELDFRWQDVDLASIPLHWWPGANGLRLSGRISGEIRGAAAEDLTQTFELTLQARELVLDRGTDAAREQRLDYLRVSAAGRFSPTDEVLALSRFRIELPGLTISDRAEPLDSANAAAAPLEWARRGETPVLLRARIDIADAERIPPQWLTTALPANSRLAGAAQIDLDWRSTRRFDRLTFRAEGRSAVVDIPDRLRIDGTLPLQARGDITLDWPRRSFFVQDLAATVGSARLNLSAEGPLSPGDWMSLATIAGATPPEIGDSYVSSVIPRSAQLSLNSETDDAGQLLAVLPWMRRAAEGRSSPVALAASGPMCARFDLRPTQRGARFDASVTVEAASALQVGELLNKPPGRRLELNAGLELFSTNEDASLWYADQVVLSADYGESDARWIFTDTNGFCKVDTIESKPEAHVGFRSRSRASGITYWLSLSPWARRALSDAVAGGITLAGETESQITADVWIGGIDALPFVKTGRAFVSLNADNLHVQAGDAWHKPPGEPAEIGAEIRFSGEQRYGLEAITANAKAPSAVAEILFAASHGIAHISVSGGVHDFGSFLAHSPRLRNALRAYELEGAAAFDVALQQEGDDRRYSVMLDATEAAVLVPTDEPARIAAHRESMSTDHGEMMEPAPVRNETASRIPLLAKRRGVPLKLDAEVRVRSPRSDDNSARPYSIDVRPSVLRLGRSTVELTDGSLQFDGPELTNGADMPAPLALARSWLNALGSANVSAKLHCDLTPDDGLDIPELHRRLAPYDVRGPISAQVFLSTLPDSARCVAALNADLLSAAAPDAYVKHPGSRLRASWDVTLHRSAHETTEVHADGAATDGNGRAAPQVPFDAIAMTVHDFVLDAPPLALRVRGTAMRDSGASDAERLFHQLTWNLDAALDVTDLAEAADDWALPALHPRRGAFHVRLTAGGNRGAAGLDGLRLKFYEACFAPDAGESHEHDLCLDGELELSPRGIRSADLGIRLGDADVRLAMDVFAAGERFADGVTGSFMAASRYADTGRLMPRVQVWRNSLLRLQRQWSGAPAPRSPVDAPPRTSLPDEWLRFAAASDISGQVHVRDAVIPHLAGAGPFAPHELVLEPALQRGRFELPFRTAVNGGVVTGRIDCMLDRPNPWFDLAYEARDLSSEPNTRPLVEAFFPGLTVEGPITLIDATHQRLFDEPGAPNPALGSGEMILGRGTVVGRAAPLAITRIFPGLNLTRFDFTRMHNRFEKQPDGRMDNQMVFYGANYHMYVDGASYPDGRIRYEVGIDLYANLIPTLSNKGQGRIAIFIKTGRRGPDNTLLDETVSYLRPDQLLANILSDNVLTQTYHVVTDKLR